MIKSFKHKGLKYLYCDNNASLANTKHIRRICMILDRLDASKIIMDMNIPGYRLHRLSGPQQNIWSVRVSGNWRITFSFEGGNAYEVNLEDYH